MRVILDVNIWISALLWGGIPDRVLQLCEHNQFNLVSSRSPSQCTLFFQILYLSLQNLPCYLADFSRAIVFGLVI